MWIGLLLGGVAGVLSAQDSRPMRMIRIDSVVVTGARPIADIGVQKTHLDTLALRESVTNSLADVLAQNSSIFIKSYGRATLSTASFRGTAPSHTQVSWNGMKINSPMLGMVDFSLIPSYFIDDAHLYHGASSVGVTGGGLGGAITLSTQPVQNRGMGLRYIQGISSFNTFDEFLRLTYGNERWQSSTRVYYASSDNDFKYTNIYKKDFITDQNGDIIGYTRPVERNKNGAFQDLHVLQELFYRGEKGSRWGLSAWYMNSRRGVPMLNVDYREENETKNQQNEQTFRTTLSWDKLFPNLKLSGRAGYSYTDLLYYYLSGLGDGTFAEGVRSVSYVNTGYALVEAEYYRGEQWIFTGNLSAHQHFVKSRDRSVISNSGAKRTVGYNQARSELSAFVSVRYKPGERWGLAVNARQEMYGDRFTPLIPAAFAEYLLSKQGSVLLKASVARNYRYPTLNDLYFMPGGNDSLRSEQGFTYDGGVEFTLKNQWLDFKGEATLYDAYIKDWIVWLPTHKGFWTPRNVKKVHSYGLELKGRLHADLGREWSLILQGNYAVTRSINQDDPVNWADEAIGKQLVYIPEYSAAVTGKLRWKCWEFTYKWSYYSERYTTSSNESATKLGRIAPYYMSDISLERFFRVKWAGVSLKLAVNNLFDEAYESVLARPMAGRNFGLFLEITPRFKR